MKLKEYKKHTRKTVAYPEEIAFDYLTDGLNGEIGEFQGKLEGFEDYQDNEELLHELGDVLWYNTRLCDELNYSIKEIRSNDVFLETDNMSLSKLGSMLNYECSKLSELSKKIKRDDKDIGDISENLLIIYLLIEEISEELGYDLDKLTDMNIDKLLDRKERDKIKGDGDKR